MKRRSVGWSAVAVLFCLTPSTLAFNKANPGPWDVSDLPIPVYFNENLDDLICPDSSCSSFDEIRWSTDVTLDEFHDSSGSRVRLRFAGTTDAAIGEVIDGAIHIFASASCNDSIGVAAWSDTNGDGRADWGKVRLCSKFKGDTVSWESFRNSSSTLAPSWQGVVAHEITHTLGFDHPPTGALKSIVGTNTGNTHHGHHLYKDDIDAYQSNYEFRLDKDMNFKRSSTGSDWSDESTPPAFSFALSRLSACTTSSSRSTFVAFPNDKIPRLVQLWRYDGVWTQLTSPPLSATDFHAGVACQDSQRIAVAWLSGGPSATGDQSVILASTENAGANWSIDRIAEGGFETRNAGVSAAFDPESGHYIVMWRDDVDQISSKVNAPGAVIQNYQMPDNTLLRASDSVSIACGPADVVGPENCIVAWADVGWFRTLRWAHASVDTSGTAPALVLGEVHRQGYIIFGTPSVAQWSSGQFPWSLVFHQGGRTAYTLRKTADLSASWQDETSISAGSKIVSPVVGSRTRATSGDDVIVERVYVFFTSSDAP